MMTRLAQLRGHLLEKAPRERASPIKLKSLRVAAENLVDHLFKKILMLCHKETRRRNRAKEISHLFNLQPRNKMMKAQKI